MANWPTAKYPCSQISEMPVSELSEWNGGEKHRFSPFKTHQMHNPTQLDQWWPAHSSHYQIIMWHYETDIPYISAIRSDYKSAPLAQPLSSSKQHICQEEADLLSQWTSRWMAKMISLLTKTKPSEQHYLWCHCVTSPSSLLKKAVPSICFMHSNIHTTCQNFVPTRDYRDQWQFAKMLNESFKILQQSSFLFCFVLFCFRLVFLVCFLFLIEWYRRRHSKMWDMHGHRRETAWNQIWTARDVQFVVNIKSVE